MTHPRRSMFSDPVYRINRRAALGRKYTGKKPAWVRNELKGLARLDKRGGQLDYWKRPQSFRARMRKM